MHLKVTQCLRGCSTCSEGVCALGERELEPGPKPIPVRSEALGVAEVCICDDNADGGANVTSAAGDG